MRLYSLSEGDKRVDISKQDESILNLIQGQFQGLSKGQKAVARYILDHYDEATDQTAARIGHIVGVSESTVVRFATELGFEGYPHFQKELREELKGSLTAAQRMRATARLTDSDDILGKILLGDSENLHRAYEQRDLSSFKTATRMLLAAKRVYILGIRSCAPLASFLSFYLNLMLTDVRLIQTLSGSEIFEQILNIEEGDLFIGISFPRYSQRTLRAMAYAHDAGAATLAVTDRAESSLAQEADCALLSHSDMVSFVDSLTVTFSMLTALLVSVASNRQTLLTERLTFLEKVWDEYGVYVKNNDIKPQIPPLSRRDSDLSADA